jgi:hypothetical protein
VSARMSGTVAVTTGQPIVVPGSDSGGWVSTRAFPSARPAEVRFVLYDVDLTNAASIIMEGAEDVVAGVATHSEVIEKDVDISCAPGEQKTYSIKKCSFPFVRLSAAGPSPGYSSTNVQGGIEVIQ